MRALIVLSCIWLLTVLASGSSGILSPLQDHGFIDVVQEACMLVLLVLLVDWLFMPGVDLNRVIRSGRVRWPGRLFKREGDEVTLSEGLRIAIVRGWFTFLAALVIAFALIQYT